MVNQCLPPLEYAIHKWQMLLCYFAQIPTEPCSMEFLRDPKILNTARKQEVGQERDTLQASFLQQKLLPNT